jgi:hypothetical protein
VHVEIAEEAGRESGIGFSIHAKSIALRREIPSNIAANRG